jgi:hypothetical protein
MAPIPCISPASGDETQHAKSARCERHIKTVPRPPSQPVARVTPDCSPCCFRRAPFKLPAPVTSKAPPYHPIKDFIDFGLVATAPAVRSINAALPQKSLVEFVDFAERDPLAD